MQMILYGLFSSHEEVCFLIIMVNFQFVVFENTKMKIRKKKKKKGRSKDTHTRSTIGRKLCV